MLSLEDIRKDENEIMEVFKYSKRLEEALTINPASGCHPYRRLLARVLTPNDYDDVLKDFHAVNEAVMKLQTLLKPKMKHMIAIGNIDFEFIK